MRTKHITNLLCIYIYTSGLYQGNDQWHLSMQLASFRDLIYIGRDDIYNLYRTFVRVAVFSLYVKNNLASLSSSWTLSKNVPKNCSERSNNAAARSRFQWVHHRLLDLLPLLVKGDSLQRVADNGREDD